MFLHLCFAIEPLSTQLARVVKLTRMFGHVIFQLIFISKALSTILTRIGSPLVSAHVPVVIVFILKPFLTIVAPKLELPLVRTHVTRETVFRRKFSITLCAQKFILKLYSLITSQALGNFGLFIFPFCRVILASKKDVFKTENLQYREKAESNLLFNIRQQRKDSAATFSADTRRMEHEYDVFKHSNSSPKIA